MLKTQALTSSVQSLISRISSFMTLLNNYPENTTVEDLLARLGINLNTSFDLLDGVLEVLGVNEDKILDWFSGIITPEWLDAFGENVKYLLLLQLKSVFTCNVNPFLPDNLMEVYRDISSGGENFVKGDGVIVDIDTIDIMGTLDYCPTSKRGSIYYFDNGKGETETITPSAEENQKAIDFMLEYYSDERKIKNKFVSGKEYENLKKKHKADKEEFEKAKTISDNYSYNTYVNPSNPKGEEIYHFIPAFAQNDAYKSRDFDVFLWYLLHESSNINLNSRRKCIWDNRIKKYPVALSNKDTDKYTIQKLLDDNNYTPWLKVTARQSDCQYKTKGSPSTLYPCSFLTNTKDETVRKEYFLFENIKDGGKQLIRMTLNPNRYYQKYTINIPMPSIKNTTAEITTTTANPKKKTAFVNDLGNVVKGARGTINSLTFKNSSTAIGFNKTLFEFDYDFISSIKIFDSKVILARILNAMSKMTLTAGLNLKLSETTQGIKGVVQNIVHDIMEEIEEIDIDNYFHFSNEEYEVMLNKTQADVEGLETNDTSDQLLFALSKTNDATLNTSEQQSAITHAITIASSATTAAQNGTTGSVHYLTLGGVDIFKFIKDLLEATVTEIVLSIVSPKIAMIFAVNSYITEGDDLSNKWDFSDFIRNMTNLIVSMGKQVLQQIIDELYAFVIQMLQLLVEKIIIQLTLERIEFYIRQLKALKRLLQSAANTIKNNPLLNTILGLAGGTSSFDGQSGLAVIDNVGYADIIPTKTEPDTT